MKTNQDLCDKRLEEGRLLVSNLSSFIEEFPHIRAGQLFSIVISHLVTDRLGGNLTREEKIEALDQLLFYVENGELAKGIGELLHRYKEENKTNEI